MRKLGRGRSENVRVARLVDLGATVTRRAEDAHADQRRGREEFVQNRQRDRRPKMFGKSKADRKDRWPVFLIEKRRANGVEHSALIVWRRIDDDLRTRRKRGDDLRVDRGLNVFLGLRRVGELRVVDALHDRKFCRDALTLRTEREVFRIERSA
jgi:hypothetical protein